MMPLISETALGRRGRDAPAASDILCEGCGYRLNGLPTDSRCPECGKPIAESVAAGRAPTAWDRAFAQGAERLDPSLPEIVSGGPQGRVPAMESNLSRSGFRAFLTTSAIALFHPARFYRTLATRAPLAPARIFAHAYWVFCSILFAIAATVHSRWYFSLLGGGGFLGSASQWAIILIAPAFFVLTYAALYLTTKFAARLTTWEATYRGYRLPIDVVLRGMYYHASHYLPVALIACVTVVGFITAFDEGLVGAQHLTTYLYVLSAEVVLGAGYLFATYWTGMRSMMYANE